MSDDLRPPQASGIVPQVLDLTGSLRQFLRRHGVSSGTLVVGVSGGADSTALLLALHQLREELQLLLVVTHLDHGWRHDSADDADHVRQLAGRLNLPVVVRTLTPNSLRPTEAAARQSRREFFAEVAQQYDARWVALGHTANDQVETVLHRLLRGAGLRGLGGMEEVSPLNQNVDLVRPFLSIPRCDVETWLRAKGDSWRTDSTNADSRWTRNRIRHQLLPQLREQFNPEVDEALLRLARQAREVANWLADRAHDLLDAALLEESPQGARLSVAVLRRHPPVVIREAFRELWRQQRWPEAGMTADHWQSLADAVVVEADVAASKSLPGSVQLERSGMILRLTFPGQAANARRSAADRDDPPSTDIE